MRYISREDRDTAISPQAIPVGYKYNRLKVNIQYGFPLKKKVFYMLFNLREGN